MADNQFSSTEKTFNSVLNGIKTNPFKTIVIVAILPLALIAHGYFDTIGTNFANGKSTPSVPTTTPCSITMDNSHFDNSDTAISLPSNPPPNTLCGTNNSFNNNKKDIEIRNP